MKLRSYALAGTVVLALVAGFVMMQAPARAQSADGEPLQDTLKALETTSDWLTVPPGTILPATLNVRLSSVSARPGDVFISPLRSPVKGQRYFPANSRVVGVVRRVQHGRGRLPGIVHVDFTMILLPNGRSLPIKGSLVSLANPGAGKLVPPYRGMAFGVKLGSAVTYHPVTGIAAPRAPLVRNAAYAYRVGPRNAVFINGCPVNLRGAPITVREGGVLIPIQPVLDQLGIRYEYYAVSHTIRVFRRSDNQVVEATACKSTAYGPMSLTMYLSTEPLIWGPTMLVPIDFLAAATQMRICWNADTRVVTICPR